ncbi:chitin elicitor-binding protein [Aristolochia californica]|uniref:chitin elicitor-binding protein n=1 Tax=Aristolochia californica TaxID=171875 RepID=UPI0035DBB0BC
MGCAFTPVLALCLFLAASATAFATNFTCNTSDTCQSFAGYSPINSTTLSAIKTLFAVKSFHSLLAANSLSLSTSSDYPIPNGTVVRVPFRCRCSDGRALSSNRLPVYTVQKGDGLDAIARYKFSGLVTSQEIADANNIPDPDVISVGQDLWIPLPCSCDDVDGYPTVHYVHKVVSGSSVESIAADFGTTPETLMRINGIQDPKTLQAEAILDVPLRACNSTIEKTAEDGSLRVPNGSYTLTAGNCVQCSCSSTTWALQCGPAQGVTNPTRCPPVQCKGGSNLFLGNTTGGNGCEATTCSYAGYASNGTILTALIRPPTCSSGAPASSPPGNSAPALEGRSWRWVSLGFLCIVVFW